MPLYVLPYKQELPHIPAMVTLEALAYLTRCQPQEGHGYRSVKRVYLLQVGAAAGGTAGRISGTFGVDSLRKGNLSLMFCPCRLICNSGAFFFLFYSISLLKLSAIALPARTPVSHAW